MTRLSILIVNWKSKDYVRLCLKSIYRECAEIKPQIVVVDGGSFDGCDTMLAKEFTEVVFVQSPENIGFGRSNNLGFEQVKGDYVLLLNPDTELKPGAVQSLLAELQRNPEAGILGPKLLNTDGTLQTSSVHAFPTPLNQALDSDFLRHWLPNSKLWGVAKAFASPGPTKVEAVSGACMLLRSEIYRRVGGFSPQFFMYAEDIDLCAKITNEGLSVIHVPTSEVVHHGGGSSRTQVSQFSTVMMRESVSIYMQLHHGTITIFAYRLLQAASAMVRIVILLPLCIPLRKLPQSDSRHSLKKWWHVLRWAIGNSPISVPQILPSKRSDLEDPQMTVKLERINAEHEKVRDT